MNVVSEKKPKLSIFQKIENMNLALNAARGIGCVVTNVNAKVRVCVGDRARDPQHTVMNRERSRDKGAPSARNDGMMDREGSLRRRARREAYCCTIGEYFSGRWLVGGGCRWRGARGGVYRCRSACVVRCVRTSCEFKLLRIVCGYI